MRNQYNWEELQAAKMLDMVREGINVPDEVVKRALFVLGDLVGFRDA